MTSVLLIFSVLMLIAKSLAYQPDKHQVDFQHDNVAYQLQLGKNVKLGTQIIKGNNGEMYEVTIYPSRKLYETHVETTEQLETAVFQPHPPAINSTPNFQQPVNNQQHQFNNLQQHFHQNSAAFQNHHNQFTFNLNYQQQQTQNGQQTNFISQKTTNQQLQQPGMFSQIAQQQQQQNNPQKHNNNENYYVSQSEASQLGGSYKQVNDNPRPFLRVITKCDASGQCESQNVFNTLTNGNDFKHQQVLQQSRAKVQLSADKSQQKLNHQFTGNALTSNVAKALRGIPISKGMDLKNRRLFQYCELAIPQYPHN